MASGSCDPCGYGQRPSGVDEEGQGTVDQQRLYQLVREPGSITDRTFEITFLAPGVEGYIPIDLAIGDSAALTAHPALYPPSKMLHLQAINETVPIYTGRIRVLREVTIGKSAPVGDLLIEGAFRYQACDDEKCFIPETGPVKWALRVDPPDRQRAPAEIQHKTK